MMHKDDLLGFLHRHPKMEASAGIDDEHVIVDKGDWDSARELQAACRAAAPCLQDWIRTTGFGDVHRRDKDTLNLIELAIAKAEQEATK